MTVVILDDLKHKTKASLIKSTMPYYAVIANDDTVVCNDTISEQLDFKISSRVQSFKGVDHMSVLRDPKTVSTIVRNTIAFFD